MNTYHPIVNFTYFTFVILFSVILKHPLCIAISFACSFLYLVTLKMKYTKYITAIISVIMITYPLFNHGGVTIITYLPSGNPFTAESVFYAVATGFSLAGILGWILCCTRVLSSDKLMCVLGKVHPSLSLVFSMTLKFFPCFVSQLRKTLGAYRGMGLYTGKTNIFKKIKIYFSVFSITVTWAAESSIETSESMRARGYGIAKRTSFSPYILKKKDVYMLAIILFLSLFTLITQKTEGYRYFPLAEFKINNISGFLTYFIFCSLPPASDIYVNTKYKFLISKMHS